MITRYALLVRMTARHPFYHDGLSPDFLVVPSPATQQLLDRAGLLFRSLTHGFAVYAEVEPGLELPVLLRPLADEVLHLTFLLHLANPFFLNVTEIDPHAMGEEVFYFSNLDDFRDDPDDPAEPLALGDPVVAARVGPPVRLVSSGRYVYAFENPVTSAILTVTDVFGVARYTVQVTFEEAAEVAVLRLDEVDDLPPGRYTVADDGGGSEAIYYGPGLFGAQPFGLIDLYSRTDTLTPDADDLVPADYHFLDGAEITGRGDYAVRFEPRATTWRYVVTKQYGGSTVALAGLDIPGGAFTKTTSGSRAVFTSNARIPLSEAGTGHDLEHNGAKLIDLPSPGRNAPLQKGAAGHFTSEMYIYV